MAVNEFMLLAIEQAKKAENLSEMPVGAVVVKDGTVISMAHNEREGIQNSLAHAEILAIHRACKVLKTWRFDDCDIYVTLEPCIMCAGAIVQARMRNCYFGSFDAKAGAFGSYTDLSRLKNHNQVNVYGGIMEDECVNLLKNFFETLRNK